MPKFWPRIDNLSRYGSFNKPTYIMNKYPDWALWVAKDEDGKCWAYEVEPLQFHKGWYENELGRNEQVICPIVFNEQHWKDSLVSIKTI